MYKRKSAFALFLLFALSSCFGQSIEYKFRCWPNTTVFELPPDFKSSHFSYYEGHYDTYYKIDSITNVVSSRLTLHCGNMVQLPHLQDSSFIVVNSSEFERSGKQLNGGFWRELNLLNETNFFYQDASFKETQLFDGIIEKIISSKLNIKLTNTTKLNEQNIYTYSLNLILDSLSQAGFRQFVIQGGPANRIHSKYLDKKILNAETKRVFDQKKHLLRSYKHLVGVNLVRLVIKPVFVEESRIKVPIQIAKTTYLTKKKSSTELIFDGQWLFSFKFNSSKDSFELESIEKGIFL